MEEHLLALLNIIEFDMFWMLIKLMVVFILFLGLKDLLYMLVLYIRVRFSDMFSKNQIIEYNDWRGKISSIGFNGLTIRNQDGGELFIPLDRVKYGKIVYPAIDYEEKE